jgi:hypothetical protein
MAQWIDISAVTFAVGAIVRSIQFYRKLGFELVYGDENASFSSLKAGDAGLREPLVGLSDF